MRYERTCCVDCDIVEGQQCSGRECKHPHFHVFTDDDFGRDGHMRLNGYGNDFVHTANYTTHVAIPVEQYVRIFGEL